MREHNEVYWSFLIAIYGVLACVVLYILREIRNKKKTEIEDAGKEKEELTFIGVFIQKDN